MNKFQVGDHVKGTLRGFVEKGYPITNQNLIDAKVITIVDDSEIAIRCRRFLDGNNEYVGIDIFVDPKYFDYADGYIPDPQEPKGNIFTINGNPYTNEQYIKDAARFVKEFPNDKNIELSHAIEDILIVYQYAQDNPPISNLDHYAEELGWDEEQKESVRRLGTPLPNFYSQPFDKVGKEWWDQEYKPKKHFTSSKQN
jgi:hypothetical protein